MTFINSLKILKLLKIIKLEKVVANTGTSCLVAERSGCPEMPKPSTLSATLGV